MSVGADHTGSAPRTFARAWADPCHLGDLSSRLSHLSGCSPARPHARRPATDGIARSCRRRARPRGQRAPGACTQPASYAGRWRPGAGRARAGGAVAGTRGRPVREASASFVRRAPGRCRGAQELCSRRAGAADGPACASAARPPRSRCPSPAGHKPGRAGMSLPRGPDHESPRERAGAEAQTCLFLPGRGRRAP